MTTSFDQRSNYRLENSHSSLTGIFVKFGLSMRLEIKTKKMTFINIKYKYLFHKKIKSYIENPATDFKCNF